MSKIIYLNIQVYASVDMDSNGNATNHNLGLEGPTNPMVTPLLTDLYQFTMAYAYWKAGKHLEMAVYALAILFT